MKNNFGTILSRKFPFSERGIAFYFGLLISDEKISVGFLIAILILLAVCNCFS